MAFRELSPEELEFLTDSQRKVYEKKLKNHRERVRFVEQLEKMENVQIEPFQPKLDPIPSISKAPEKEFIKAEQQNVQVPGVKTVTVKVRVRPVPPVEEVALPQVVRPGKVRVVSVADQTPKAPELPEVRPLRMPHGGFQAGEPVKAKVRAVASVRSPEVIYSGPEAVRAEVPATVKPAVRSCPEVIIGQDDIKPCTVSTVAAQAPVPALVQIPSVEPHLPKTSAVVLKAPALMTVDALQTDGISCAVSDVSIAVVKQLSGASCLERTYQKPENAPPVIPAAVKVQVKEHRYHAPTIQKTKKTKAQPVRIPDWTVEQSAPTKVQVAYPASVNTPKIDYQKWEYEVQQMPETAAVAVPDPHSNEILHALLLRANNK